MRSDIDIQIIYPFFFPALFRIGHSKSGNPFYRFCSVIRNAARAQYSIKRTPEFRMYLPFREPNGNVEQIIIDTGNNVL